MPSRSQRKVWRSLRRRKGRSQSGLFLLEGPRLLAEALASDVQVEALLCARPARHEAEVAELAGRCQATGIVVEWLEEREFASIAATVTPQGVAAVARVPQRAWSELRGPRLLVLDGVQDPGNAGTLIRTAEALGLGGVVCLPGTADPWSPKVVRAAAGSVLRLPVLQVSWAETKERLRRLDARLWIADAAGEPVGRGTRVPARLGLALGSEAHGVSDAVRESADRVVSIGMAAPVDSLNVAVAGAILMDRLFGADGSRVDAEGSAAKGSAAEASAAEGSAPKGSEGG